MKYSFFRLKTLLPVFALATLFASCSKSDSNNTGGQAKLMVVHASPDAPNIDVLVDNSKVNISAIAYPNNSGYYTVNAGTRNLKINTAGTATTLINSNVTIVANSAASVFVYDSAAAIKAIAVPDDLTAPASGKAKVRFFHLAPGAPTVDIGIWNGATFSPYFNNRSFETQTTAVNAAGFVSVDAGTYNFQVRLAGTTTVAVDLPGIVLEAGKIYTVFAKGFVTGTGTQALGAQLVVHN